MRDYIDLTLNDDDEAPAAVQPPALSAVQPAIEQLAPLDARPLDARPLDARPAAPQVDAPLDALDALGDEPARKRGKRPLVHALRGSLFTHIENGSHGPLKELLADKRDACREVFAEAVEFGQGSALHVALKGLKKQGAAAESGRMGHRGESGDHDAELVLKTLLEDEDAHGRRTVDVNSRTKLDGPALSYAINSDFPQRVAEKLIEARADVNATASDGTTCLMDAASEQRLDLLKLLLENGADPDARDKDGRTALHAACVQSYDRTHDRELDVLTLLLEKGADPAVCASDWHGLVAPTAGCLAYACGLSDQIVALLDAAAHARGVRAPLDRTDHARRAAACDKRANVLAKRERRQREAARIALVVAHGGGRRRAKRPAGGQGGGSEEEAEAASEGEEDSDADEDEDEQDDAPTRRRPRAADGSQAAGAGAAGSSRAPASKRRRRRSTSGARGAAPPSRGASGTPRPRVRESDRALNFARAGSSMTWRGCMLKVLYSATMIENVFPSGAAPSSERDKARLAKLWGIVNVYAGYAIGWLRARPKRQARSLIVNAIDCGVIQLRTTTGAGASEVRAAVQQILDDWAPTSWQWALVEAHHVATNTHGGGYAFTTLVDQARTAGLGAADARAILGPFRPNVPGPSKAAIKQILVRHKSEHLLEEIDDGLDDDDGGDDDGAGSDGDDGDSVAAADDADDDDGADSGDGEDESDASGSTDAQDEEARPVPAPSDWVHDLASRVYQPGDSRARILSAFRKDASKLPGAGARVGPQSSPSVLHACAKANSASLLELLLVVHRERTGGGGSAMHGCIVDDLLGVAVKFGAVDAILQLLSRAGDAVVGARLAELATACVPATGAAQTSAQARSLDALAVWSRMRAPHAPAPPQRPPLAPGDLSRGLEPVPIAWQPEAEAALCDFLYIAQPLVLSPELEAIATYSEGACRRRATRDTHHDWLVRVRLEVRLGDDDELRVFALQNIPKDTFVCVFAGEVKLLADVDEAADDRFVLRTHGARTLVDARRCGNVGRFIKSSLQPNLAVQDVSGGHGAGHTLPDGTTMFKMHWTEFVAKRSIRAGEELGYRRG